MSLVCSLAADELSDRIQGLHQNLVQLRAKLEALKNGLEAISQHLRGDAVEIEEIKIEPKIDYRNFSQKVNEILNTLEHDISQQDADLVNEVKVFRSSLIDGHNRDALRNIDAQNIEQAIQVIKSACEKLVNSLLEKYSHAKILKVQRSLADQHSYHHAVSWISDDTSDVGVDTIRSYTDVLKSCIENGQKQDAEILKAILPKIGWRSPGSRLAFSLLENGFYEPNFLWWAATAILWYIGQGHGVKNQYQPSLDGALYYLLNGLSHTQFRMPLITSQNALTNILLACRDYTNSKKIRFPGEAAVPIPSDKQSAKELIIDGVSYQVFFTEANLGRGYSLTGQQVRAEVLATLYARFLMDEIIGLEQEVIRIKKRHEKEVRRQRDEEDRKRRENEQREREEQRFQLEEKERIRLEEEKKRLAALEEKDRKEAQERFQREEEERRQRKEEEEENLRKEDERRREEEEDRLFNESISEIKDEVKVVEKQSIELNGLLEVIKLIAAIDSNQDIIDAASKHSDARVRAFKFIDYLGWLLQYINANELRSNKSLNELLGYTDKIVRNILASGPTLQNMFIRIQQTNELKVVAELMRCLLLIKDHQIILPVGENRLTIIDPASHKTYAADSSNPSNTNILKNYFRVIARADNNAKEEAQEFYDQHKNSLKMGFKKTLMDHLKEELDKQK